jgi:cytochrome c oxidase subunit 2
MTQILLIAIVVMIFIVIFQIAKASEYVSVLKGEEKAPYPGPDWGMVV